MQMRFSQSSPDHQQTQFEDPQMDQRRLHSVCAVGDDEYDLLRPRGPIHQATGCLFWCATQSRGPCGSSQAQASASPQGHPLGMGQANAFIDGKRAATWCAGQSPGM